MHEGICIAVADHSRYEPENREMGVTKYGEGNEHTIKVGRIYAINLQKANRGDDARELLMKLQAQACKSLVSPQCSKEVDQRTKWNVKGSLVND